jgi:hypothetical protein
MSEVIRESILTCPACNQTQAEVMPVDACQYFYECAHCGVMLKPKAGDCCVFCSYGTVKCPPKQAGIGDWRVWGVTRRRPQRPTAEEPFRLPANISMHKEILPDGTAERR